MDAVEAAAKRAIEMSKGKNFKQQTNTKLMTIILHD